MTRHLDLYTPYFYLLEVRGYWETIKRKGVNRIRFKIMKNCWSEMLEDMDDND
jgi:hypothetical protein